MQIPLRERRHSARPFACLLLLWIAVGESTSGQELQKVTLQLKWKHQFQFAGYYAAVHKGYYKDAGLDVSIVEQTDTVASEVVAKGGAEYGVEGPELLRQRALGKPLVLLAAIFQHDAEVLAVREDAGIRNPQELGGAHVAISASGTASVRAMLAHEGVALGSLHTYEPSGGLDDLIERRVVARTVYVTDAPFILDQRHLRYLLMRPLTYGIDFYGDCLFTTESELAMHPDRARAFREASLKGWRYAMANPEEMIGIIHDQYKSALSLGALAYEAGAMRPLILPDFVDLGHVNPGRWQHIADTYAGLGLMPADSSLEGFIYDPSAPPDTRNRRNILLAAAAIAAFGAFAAGFLALFNYRLRRTVRARTVELHAVNQQLRAMFDNSVELVGLLRPDGTLIEANRTALQLIGARLEDVAGKLFWETPWWNHSKAAQATVIDAIRDAVNGNTKPRETEHPTPDGQMRQIEFSVSPIRDEAGLVVLLMPEGRDITDRRRSEDALKALVAGTAGAGGEEFFKSLVRHLAEAFGSKYSLIGELTESKDRVRTLAMWSGDHIQENIEYALEGAPCEKVMKESICVYRDSVQSLFPKDIALARLKAQSYCGVVLTSSSGEPFGVLAVLDDRPMREPDERARALLTVFAARAAAEIERLRSDTALRLSEEKFSAAFHTSTVAITLAQLRGPKLIEVNKAFEELTGYAREELIGQSSLDLGLWGEPSERARMVAELFRVGRVRNSELALHTRSGKRCVVRLSAALLDIAGEACALATIDDITEERRLEGYQASQFAITRLLSNSRDLQSAGPEILKLVCGNTGWQAGELWLKSAAGSLSRAAVFSDISRAPEASSEIIERIAATTGPTWFPDLPQKRTMTPDETWTFRSACVVPLVVLDASVGALVVYGSEVRDSEPDLLAVLSDIAAQVASFLARQRLEDEQATLRESLTRAAGEWRRTFDAINSPTLITDRSGRVRRLNRAAIELSGRAQTEILGRHLEDLGSAEPWRTAAALLREILAGGPVHEGQAHDEKLGRRWDVFVRVAEAGENLEERVIVGMRDITTIVALQESLRRTERMSAMGSLVAGVAHEVRNPLFSITATLDTLQTDLHDNPSFAECWPILQSQVGRLTRLMRDLLDYGKPPSRKRQPTQIRDVLRRALRNCADAANAADVIVRDMSEEETLPLLELDGGRIEQVFENLLANAIQHSPKGGQVDVAVRHVVTGDKSEVQCSFEDHGPGIPPADLPKLFEPFFSRRKGGTGLGLPISQSIVEDHGGTLLAATRPERGAIFTVILPAPAVETQLLETRG